MAGKKINSTKDKQFAEAMMAAMARDNVGNTRRPRKPTATARKKK